MEWRDPYSKRLGIDGPFIFSHPADIIGFNLSMIVCRFLILPAVSFKSKYCALTSRVLVA